jgi:ABC-type lipoprotein release transport system permease subunit
VTSLSADKGVTSITQVIRGQAVFMVNEYQRLDFDLLAVDPITFPEVVSFPPGISPYSIEQILSVLELDSPDLLPVVVSSSIHTRHLNIGDQITLEMGAETYLSEVVGIIVNFPLVDDVFAITDLSRFVQLVDLESMALENRGTRETWLAVDPDAHKNLLTKLTEAGFGDSIVGNSQAQLKVIQNNLVYSEVTTAFNLNALVLVPLSVVGYTLIQVFTAQRRAVEFSILQSMGFSRPQIRRLLLLEGFMFVMLGILIGTGIGFGLSTLMQPFLAQILPPLGGGFVLTQLEIDWSEIGFRFVALVVFYGVGLLLLMVRTIRHLRSVQL